MTGEATRLGAQGGGRPRPVWDGRAYTTHPTQPEQRARDVFKWMAQRRPPKWHRIEVSPRTVEVERVDGADLLVHWVGHSTLLVQVSGLNILTDPIWSRACGPGGWLGPRRFAAPGLRFDGLPAIDVVLLSHDHYDHCDVPTLKRLEARDRPLFCVPSGMAALARKWRASHVAERTWWDAVDVGDVRFEAVPAQHFSGRGPTDRGKRLWCGWAVRTPRAGELLYVGDTGWWEAGYRAIKEALPSLRFAAIPIGAYEPRWFMSPVHVDPAEAVQLFETVGCESALAVHHRTFQLADDGMDAPASELAVALTERRIAPGRFRVLEHGERWQL